MEIRVTRLVKKVGLKEARKLETEKYSLAIFLY